MRRRLAIFFAFVMILAILPLSISNANEDKKVLRVGMEAAYAPFNWTQEDDSNGAIPIEGSNQFANGYDVQIAKRVASKLGMEAVAVKTEWDGLLPSLLSGKIDVIIAGMSPTAERKETIDFSNNYYNSNYIMVVNAKGKFANATSINDFDGAKITGQLNTMHDEVVDQIPNVEHVTALPDNAALRVAVESGKIDGYVTERPEGVSAELANDAFKLIELDPGFDVTEEQTAVAIGIVKNSELLAPINDALATISPEEQQKIMDEMISIDLGIDPNDSIWDIAYNNRNMFISGTIYTILISLVGTILGLLIGMVIGIIRTFPIVQNTLLNIILVIAKFISNIYVQVIRGTPMMVQAVLFYYGLELLYGFSFDSMTSAFIIVSVNTGAYMAEVVRGGINSIDSGQVEAAKALGMNHWTTMTQVILPQVIKNIIPNVGNEFIVNIKDTSVLNVISVKELFFNTRSIAGSNFKFFQTYLITSVIYLILTLTISGLLRLVEKRLEVTGSYKKVQNDVLGSSN